jgi:hypothetical protein
MNATISPPIAQLNQPTLPESASSNHVTPIGLDVGNGAVKMFSGMGQTLMESYVLYLSERATHANLGYVEYITGDRPDLAGKQWIGGLNAYYQEPTGIYRVNESDTGKADLCLQLLLSALTAQPHRQEWTLHLCASVHDGKVFGKLVRSALSGTHHVRLLGQESTVTVTIGKILEEGSGVAYTLKSAHDFTNALLFDLGNGTSIVSAFNGMQMSYRDYSREAGVERLFDTIATSDTVRSYLKRPGDRHLIRAGVEKGDFSYGTRYPDWNFKDSYIAALPSWFEQGLKPFVKAAETRVPAATAIIAVGGGSCLPGMPGLLAKKGIAVPQDARWLNAKGLYQIALRVSSEV